MSDTDECPAFKYDGGKLEATCLLVTLNNHEQMGIGKGCCIKARAFHNGEMYDFASLPLTTKKRLALRKLVL